NGRYRRIRKSTTGESVPDAGGGPGVGGLNVFSNSTPLDPTILSELKQDPSIASCEPLMFVRITATPPRKMVDGRDPRSDRIGIPPMSPTLIGTEAAESPWELEAGRWLNLTDPEAIECVLGSAAAQRMELNVGDNLIVTSDATELSVKIVGLVKQARATPTIGSGGGLPTSSLFVPISLAEKFSGKKRETTVLCIELKDGVDAQEFRDRWNESLARKTPPSSFADTETVVRSMSGDRSVRGQRTQANWTLGVALLAAVFIIFTTLSMGVQEKVRQLAILRAVALTRGQIAGIVFFEALCLAIPGWIVGVITCSLVSIVTRICGIGDGGLLVLPDMESIVLGGLCSIGGAMIAAILPAWRAGRIAPIRAIQETTAIHQMTGRRILTMAVVGALLVSIHFVIVYWPEMPTTIRSVLYTVIGCPLMTIGFLLLTPMIVRIVETLLTRPLSKLMRLEPQLLFCSLSGNMGRSVGTAAAMTIGLGLFVSIHVWGFTMLVPFLPNDDVPNAFVAFLPDGLPEKEVSSVTTHPGIRVGECLPVAVEQMSISSAQLATPGFESTHRGNQNVVLAGFDLSEGMSGEHAIFHLKFIEGNAEEAIRKIESGERDGSRYCLIPDTMKTQLGLSIGSALELVPPKRPDRVVRYEVAGVVYIPGSIWLTKTSGMRRQGGRTLGLVLTTYENVRTDAELERIGFFWMNLEDRIDARKFEGSLQKIARRNVPENLQFSNGDEVAASRPIAKLWYAPEIIESVGDRSSGIIWGMSRLPIVILIITSLVVMNTILASVRTRTWEIGVLRAIGFSRSTIIRQILSESILVGLTAIFLSLAFGLTAGWCSVITARYMYVYAVTGLSPDLVIPWSSLTFGFGLALTLCVAAAIVPAIRTGRREVADLLRSGRAVVE
ncbi:MAG: ABC transporter permease, partial [Planctomycetia bacterium]|nr:ABC transporter permease [Planctomycetia bacterium]